MNDAKDPKAVPQISIDALAQAFAAAMKDNRPTAGMLTGMSEERLERVQGKHEKPLKYRIVKGKSPDSLATFDQHVVESRTHKHGRVVRLDNYKHPAEAYIQQSQGGMMPDATVIWQDPKNQMPLGDSTPSHLLNNYFKQWRWETFWQADLRRIANGAPLRAECCIDGAKAFETPWIESSLYEEQAAE